PGRCVVGLLCLCRIVVQLFLLSTQFDACSVAHAEEAVGGSTGSIRGLYTLPCMQCGRSEV
ncbi:hypothetical protein GJAV_G00264860, partial [Gymnothorax javanicus]